MLTYTDAASGRYRSRINQPNASPASPKSKNITPGGSPTPLAGTVPTKNMTGASQGQGGKIKPSKNNPNPLLLDQGRVYYGEHRWGAENGIAKLGRKVFRLKGQAAERTKSSGPYVATVKPSTKHILTSVTNRALDDMDAFSACVWRLLSLPIGIMSGIKALKGKWAARKEQQAADGVTRPSKKEVMNPAQNEAYEAYMEALKGLKKVFTQDDQTITAATDALKQAHKNLQAAFLNVKIPPFEEAPASLKAAAAEERMDGFKASMKWYFAGALGVVANILGKIATTGIPLLGPVARLLGYLATALKAYLEGSPKLEELHALTDRYDNRKAAKKSLERLKVGGDKELEIIAKQIKNRQSIKSEALIYLKQVIDIAGFLTLTAGSILGAVSLVGVIGAAAGIILVKASVVLVPIALGMGAIYLAYRLTRWISRLAKIGYAERQFQRATDEATKQKHLEYLLRHDGKFASWVIIQRLREESINARKLGEPKSQTKDFLKKFVTLGEEEWAHLDHITDETFDDTVKMLGNKLYIY
jgi:hypothetical protein